MTFMEVTHTKVRYSQLFSKNVYKNVFVNCTTVFSFTCCHWSIWFFTFRLWLRYGIRPLLFSLSVSIPSRNFLCAVFLSLPTIFTASQSPPCMSWSWSCHGFDAYKRVLYVLFCNFYNKCIFILF